MSVVLARKVALVGLIPAIIVGSWFTAHLLLVLALVGAEATITTWWCAARRVLDAWRFRLLVSRREWVAVSDDEDPARAQLPLVHEMAPRWRREPGSSALTAFLEQFEQALEALRARLAQALGEEVSQRLPLHEQLKFATGLSLWSEQDRRSWKHCNRVRSQILAQGLPAVTTLELARHALWLEDLARRTRPETASGGAGLLRE
ncbi:hypothetical protein Kisp01_70210 [Kineosporia sp. NBRC 101677]|nr:hypothetical protein Kisp01_70210 [Kineosporia sp. NBRC 101677]